MADQKISNLTILTAFDDSEYIECIISPYTPGTNRRFLQSLLEPNRGDYTGTTSFPTSGGRFTGGVPKQGDRWRLTNTLTIGGTDIYAPGTIIEAAINSPGQTTANWVKYAVQS